MAPAVRQTNFSGGELDPKLWGRTDLPVFQRGLRTMRNFFPSRQGAAISRPGTTYVGAAKLSDNHRLIPFVYSDEQSYVLELGGGYIRFISDGGFIGAAQTRLNYTVYNPLFTVGMPVAGLISGATGTVVENTSTGIGGYLVLSGVVGTFIVGEPARNVPFTGLAAVITSITDASYTYELATTYAAGDLDALQWAQTGDILTIVHPSYPPRELRRLAHNSWTLTDVSFAAQAVYFRDVEAPYTGTAGFLVVDTSISPEDAEHPAREWTWKVTVVAQDSATGVIFETLPYTIPVSFNGLSPLGATAALPAKLPLYSDRAVILRRPTVGFAVFEPAWKALSFNFYRGRGDLFGFVGQTKTREFVDVGAEPDYAIQPPAGTNPFEVYSNVGVLVRTERPSAVAFFQERRIFAGTPERSATVFASAVGNYPNHDEHFIHLAGEALLYELAARKRENIRSLLAVNRLLVFTNSTAWSMAGTQGNPLDFDSVDARVEEEIGAGYLPPLLVDGAVLFSRAKGAGVRSLAFDDGRDGFAGSDLSSIAQHLFIGAEKTIVDWTYAEDPWGLVWAVREDGELLSLTYSKTEELWAWARHDTDGVVRNICAVPEGEEDAVYLVVEREITNGGFVTFETYIERMTSRVRRDTVEDDICLDCAGRYEDAPALTLTGLSHLEGKAVYVVGKDNPVRGPFTVASGSITLDELPTANSGTDVVLHVGLLYTPEIETLDVASTEVRNKQKQVVSVGFEVDQSRGLWVGQDFDHLKEWRQRSVSDSYGGISAATGLTRMTVSGAWEEHGRLALRQAQPLPVTIVGLTRELELGG